MARKHKQQEKIHETELHRILDHYSAEKIVIGHTVGDDIMTDFNGKVIRIDILHGQEKGTGSTKGVLMKNGIQYKIDDLGRKEEI